MRTLLIALTATLLFAPFALAEKMAPRPLTAESPDFFAYRHEGRLFVIGSEASRAKFLKNGHLPYTRTLLGSGPLGETVVFEVDKKNPELVQRLEDRYRTTPLLIAHEDDDLFVWKYNGRIYVVGSLQSNAKFMAHKHLPYTRTLLGAGPFGETVVFEVDKKSPEQVDRLERAFSRVPFLMASNGSDYFVYKMGERYYVIGDKSTSESFREHRHLPYTRTILGAGPMGETVVFEVDKKNPALAERLAETYL